VTRDNRPAVDPERDRSTNPFDHDEGSFGQSYSREREEALRKADPSGAVAADPEAGGTRASVDETGEAQGSGADAAQDPARKPNASNPGAGKKADD
jgi:hypothetical protein